MKKDYIILLCAISLLIPSCANSSHALVYQHSNFGLNVGTNPSTQQVHARFGARNEIAVITPKTNQPMIDASGKPMVDEQPKLDRSGKPVLIKGEAVIDRKQLMEHRAVSTYSASRFRVESLSKVPEVSEIVATGKAAEIIGGTHGSAAFLDHEE